jgi:class 3 adenylate cyclase/alpha-beta hydrolase superfamily lysophospholipase
MAVTRYAKSGDVHIAYQVFGEGPVDLVVGPGFISHVEACWDEPSFARWLTQLGKSARVITFDKRGTGLSDRVNDLSGLDQRMDDIRAVMDAAGSQRAALFGVSEGGTLGTLFAASHPERCQALILYGTFARWFPTEAELNRAIGYMQQYWGSGLSLRRYGPSKLKDPAFLQWWGRLERLGASPSAAIALVRMNSQLDAADILSTIRVPCLVLHRVGDMVVDIEDGRFLAKHIPGARLIELSGEDHLPFIGENAFDIVGHVSEFLTGVRTEVDIDRVLATVLLTDIVGSTIKAESLGDRGWRDLLDAHNGTVRKEFTRFRGHEVKSLGDGFLATFDGPARAIRCACAIAQAVKPLGIDVRAGLHTGEIEYADDDVRGIAVHLAARVSALAGPGEVLVSRTVRDLVAGSGLRFVERGSHALKGIQEPMQIFAAAG